MAHREQQQYVNGVKSKFPQFFSNQKVLDCGSLDINGNNKHFFNNCDYTGIDVGPGRNVDIVSLIHEFDAPDESYDVIISTECFEHDMHYELSFQNIVRLLKPEGMFIFTCATTGRAEHGTRRTTRGCAPLLQGEWSDYYMNVTEEHVRAAINIEDTFSEFKFQEQHPPHDLQFWGIKK